jgi:hypothetical protein
MNYTAIPDSVLALLKKRWRLPDGYSAFESTFDDPIEPDRRRDPSYYHLRVDSEVTDPDWQNLSHSEAVALIKDGVFGASALQEELGVALNEHADHAMQDFCSEVYEAWAKFQERMRLVEQARPNIRHRR